MAAAEKIYGIHPVHELLQGGRRHVHKVLVAAQRQDRKVQRILTLAEQRGVLVEAVARDYLDQWLGHRTHQGIAALAEPPTYTSFANVEAYLDTAAGPQTILVLDGVTDVGNFAALIRSAAAFGVGAIMLPRHHSVTLTPAVVKHSAGATEHIDLVQVTNIASALDALKRYAFWVYGADAHAELATGQVAWPERLVLVLGAEGHGIRRLVREHCDALVRIPMCPGAHSLNVAAAGAILLASSREQRFPEHKSGDAYRR